MPPTPDDETAGAATAGHRAATIVRPALWIVVCLALAAFYVAGATQHAERVNTSKARGDQSGYLWDAQQVYKNWHGRTPPMLVGQRMRMPLYAAFLAVGYAPRMSDPEFFEAARIWNIWLSLGLLVALAAMFAWHLPWLPRINLTLTVAFGYFVFKAGYTQPELLFYTLFFATFLACCHLMRGRGPRQDLFLGTLAGSLAGLTFLTKALIPPFVGIFLAVYGAREAIELIRRWQADGTVPPGEALVRCSSRAAAGIALAAAFLLVVSPYVINSKRVFGSYFFNVNTAYYIWYDSGAEARAVMLPHTDDEGRVSLAASQLPGPRQYFGTHSLRQIAARLADGFTDMIVRSYRTYWYWKYVCVYLAFALVLVAANGRAFAAMLRRQAALSVFLFLYAVVYLFGTAMFSITSGTGTTRFLLTHVTPLLFVLSVFTASHPFSDTRWSLGGVVITPTHVHLGILASWAYDLAFHLWPRLMTTYGGF